MDSASAYSGSPDTERPERTTGIPDGTSRGLGLMETAVMAWRSIRANVTRSALTTLGVIIGVAAVVALTAIGAGVTGNITDSISSLGTNLLTISSSRSFGPPGLVRSGGSSGSVTLGDAEAVLALDDARVAGVAPVIATNLQVKAGDENVNASVSGTWPSYAEVRNSATDSGRWFGEDELGSNALVAVLGSDIATTLFPGGSALGQRVKISGNSFTVVGVLPSSGSGFGDSGETIFIPITTFLQRIYRLSAIGEPTIDSVYVQGSSADVLTSLENDLTTLMVSRHDLLGTAEDDYDFQIQNQADALESLGEVSRTLQLFLGAIASISLFVGGIGIMNIMLVSVTERTREIGVRKALGAKPKDILTQFLLEAVVLSAGGGVIGLVLGVAVALLTAPLLSLTPVFTLLPMLVAFGFSLLVGVFFGFYPAQRAARLDPVASLRYE